MPDPVSRRCRPPHTGHRNGRTERETFPTHGHPIAWTRETAEGLERLKPFGSVHLCCGANRCRWLRANDINIRSLTRWIVVKAVIVAFVLAVTVPPAIATPFVGARGPVFEVITYDRTTFAGVYHGSAWFVRPQGRALTDAHVVGQVIEHPYRYGAIALIGNQFYGLRVLCSTSYGHEESEGGVVMQHDVAEIQVVDASGVPFATWKNAATDTLARAFVGRLPAFDTLAPGTSHAGDPITVAGFGTLSPFIASYAATGHAAASYRLADDTPVFDVEFDTLYANPGDSGAPVLNEQGEVVGMLTWYRMQNHAIWTAQDVSAATCSLSARLTGG